MVNFEDLHITKPIARKEFELGRLGLSDHNEDEISKAIVENVRRLSSQHEMTARQKRALSRFKYDGSCKYIKEIAPLDWNTLPGLPRNSSTKAQKLT